MKHGIPYRGNHLNVIDRRPRSSDNWELRETRTAILTQGLPNATHWDAIHELYAAQVQIHKEAETPTVQEFAKYAIKVARKYTDAPLFISEYRPDERIEWLVAFCEWAKDSRLDIAGVSLQLHSHIVSRQYWRRGHIINGLQRIRSLGYKVHLYECAAWEQLAVNYSPSLPKIIREELQRERYKAYRFIADKVGAEMFGPWFLSDKFCDYWVKEQGSGSAGIIRADGTLKPSWDIFRGES